MVAITLLCQCAGQQPCSAEIKVLLAPKQADQAKAALQAGLPVTGHVYLYDTDTLDLLAHGIVVRVRTGFAADLMVKLREQAGETQLGAERGDPRIKCEVDWSGDHGVRSYSAEVDFRGEPPQAGPELAEYLTAAQIELLVQSKAAVDWSKVKRKAEIRATRWAIRGQAGIARLSLERWQWTGGEALEVSARAGVEDLAGFDARLQELMAAKHLALNPSQEMKTTLALGVPAK